MVVPEMVEDKMILCCTGIYNRNKSLPCPVVFMKGAVGTPNTEECDLFLVESHGVICSRFFFSESARLMHVAFIFIMNKSSSQGRSQDFIKGGPDLPGGPRYPPPKTKTSPDFAYYF